MEKQSNSAPRIGKPRSLMLLILLSVLFLSLGNAWAGGFSLEKLGEGVFAAIANPGGKATSNALIVVSEEAVVIAGAHFSREVIEELQGIAQVEIGRPIRYFILAHHHRGYSHIDFDFPPSQQVIMTLQTWKGIQEEKRRVDYQPIFFSQGLTIKFGRHTLILNNLEKAHAEGDLFVYLPEENILYTSDLFYNGSVGFLGEGFMQDWVLSLDLLGSLEAKSIIPGLGKVAGRKDLIEYRDFLRSFLTETLRHLEAGHSLKETLAKFNLPRYEKLSGFQQFKQVNVTRAYRQLKSLATD